MAEIDPDRLLAWLTDRDPRHPDPAIRTIYSDLAARIRRGDFNRQDT